MRINIGSGLFTTDHLDLERINYIFGNNGTGKSTLTRMIKAQCSGDYDVRIFQGFSSIIDSDERLNAVVLGEENAAIKEAIDKAKERIHSLTLGKTDMMAAISLPDETGKGNLATRLIQVKKELDREQKRIEKFYTDAAKQIKTISTPAIAVPSYNKRNFIEDLKHASLISDSERQQRISILMSEVKTAPTLSFPGFDMEALIAGTNVLLAKKVEEKILVARLENDPEKQMFAHKGLHLHKPGDVCAFCGSIISDSVFEELGSYFSADETKALQDEINNYILKLQALRSEVQTVHITSGDFYPDYAERVDKLAGMYSESVVGYMNLFDQLCRALQDKLGHPFESMGPVEIAEKPYKIQDFIVAYADLRNKNNAADLVEKQKQARDILRLDAVKREMDKFGYERALSSLENIRGKYDAVQEDISQKKEDISQIDNEIAAQNRKINRLLAETRNEQKLAININKKLRAYVSFELEHYEDSDHKGYYRVKDPRTGASRAITQLSTGEKNIIAFLYFLEKLEELSDSETEIPKMIVFDDPMNSNDATMRYLITNELLQLVRRVEMRGRDSVVVFTHNIDCYLELCRFNSDDDYRTHNVIHLEKNNYQTSVYKVTSRRDDFTTSYGKLWRELIHLYDDKDTDADTMLNTMRRIIETYTRFNGRNWNKFCEAAGVPLALFHGGSHAVMDLSAAMNVYSKQDLVNLFWKCFDANNCSNHVKFYWPGINSLLAERR